MGNFLGIQFFLEEVMETYEAIDCHSKSRIYHHRLKYNVNSPIELTPRLTYVIVQRSLCCDRQGGRDRYS